MVLSHFVDGGLYRCGKDFMSVPKDSTRASQGDYGF